MPQPSELQIIKGITPMVGTSNTQEPARVLIDLLNPTGGISLAQDGWIPAYAELKDGGTFLGGALQSGAELAAYSEDNVTEVMKLNVKGSDDIGRYYQISRLLKMARDARSQHVADYQFMPVYLKVRLPGEPGARFALIYDIGIASRSSEPGVANLTELTITIVREPFWAWEVAPGDSPKLWTFYKRGIAPTSSNWDLEGGTSPQYEQGTVANFTTFKNSDTTYWYTNYLEIPAADIPGDAPALVQLHFDGRWDSNQQMFHSIMIGRESRENTPYVANTLTTVNTTANGYDIGALGADTTTEADNGCIDNGQSSTPGWAGSNNHRGKVAFTTLNYAKRFSWSNIPNTGTFAVFARALQSGGAQGDVRCYLKYGSLVYAPLQTPETSPVLQTISTDTEFWPLMYFGVIRFPVHDSSMLQSTSVAGILADSMSIELYAKRITATGSPTLYLSDLILMPIEDGLTEISFDDVATANGSGFVLVDVYYDSTRYLSRGRNTEVAMDSSGFVVAQVKGQPITLRPGITNRLHFLITSSDEAVTPTLGRSSIVSDPGGGAGRSVNVITVSANIVPRSVGARYE